MTTELAIRESSEIVITGDQLNVIKTTICRDATDPEMQLFFYDCKRRGVHPLDRLIHFTKRGGRYTPITSIDLFYQRAHATNQFAGQDETVFRGKPGTNDFEATVRVYRQRQEGEKAGWSATARWSEYFPGDAQGHMWRKMPNRMLEKCAEALALRKAFPTELSGLYVREEMDQAGMEDKPNQSRAYTSPSSSAVGAARQSNQQKMQNMQQPVEQDEQPGGTLGGNGGKGMESPPITPSDSASTTPPSDPEGPPPSGLTADLACRQMKAASNLAELSGIMNQWLGDDHFPEEREQVSAVFNEMKRTLGKSPSRK